MMHSDMLLKVQYVVNNRCKDPDLKGINHRIQALINSNDVHLADCLDSGGLISVAVSGPA